MKSAIRLPVLGILLLVGCTAEKPTPDGATIVDGEVSLEREALVDSAQREIKVTGNSFIVAIVDEDLTDVKIRLEVVADNSSIKPVEVENHLEGAGVEVAAIEAPSRSRVMVTLVGPQDKSTPGKVHLRVRRFATVSKFAAQLAGYQAWSVANNANNDGGVINRSGLADMTRAIASLDSPGGDAALAAEARLIKTNMLLQFTEVELFESRREAQRATKAFAALPKPDACTR